MSGTVMVMDDTSELIAQALQASRAARAAGEVAAGALLEALAGRIEQLSLELAASRVVRAGEDSWESEQYYRLLAQT